MNLPTSDQINAGLRHAGTSAATAFTVLALLGIVPQDQVQALIADMQDIVNGLSQAFGGFSKAILILGPIAAGYFTKVAITSASLRNQLNAVASNPEVHIEGQIIAPKEIADTVPSNKVVARPD